MMAVLQMDNGAHAQPRGRETLPGEKVWCRADKRGQIASGKGANWVEVEYLYGALWMRFQSLQPWFALDI